MATSLLQTRIVDKIEVILEQIDTMNKFGKSIPLIHIDMLKANVRTLYEQICELEQDQVSSPGRFHSLKESQLQARKDERKGVMKAAQTITSLVDEIEDALVQEHQPAKDYTLFDAPEVIAPITPDPIIEEPITPVLETPISFDTPVSEPLIIAEEAPQELVESTFRLELDVEVTAESYTSDVVHPDEINAPLQAEEPAIFNSLRTIADMYKGDQGLTNESILQKVSSTMHSRPSRDLKSSIGINEKFLFINDLFKGNMKEYTDTILSLNDVDDYSSAMHILEPIQTRYMWSDQSVAYLTLIELLQRKFI